MARIKYVLNERRLALMEAQRRAREDVEFPPEDAFDGDLFEKSPYSS